MPKQSKIRSTSSRPKEVKLKEDERKDFWCCRCGKHFTKQKSHFSASHSTLYRGNNGYIPVCNACLEELFLHYKKILGSGADAMKRVCSKFDIYWHPELFKTVECESSNYVISKYIKNSNLHKFVDKTYDDTLDEGCEYDPSGVVIQSPDDIELSDDVSSEQITPEIIRYWGVGFTPQMYAELENRRNYWLSQYPKGTILDPGSEAILRQICNIEIDINKERAAGRSIEKYVNTLNNLIGSMGLKPSQQKDQEDSFIPFGVEIARWEEENPIIELDEDFRDIDGVQKNVLAWFLGSLCKTAGINNDYSSYFEGEVAKYTVERPEYNDEDDDTDI